MKNWRLILVLVMLLKLYRAGAQHIVNDECLGYRTTYLRINDSVYHVTFSFKNYLLFEGGLMYPDTSKQYETNYNYKEGYNYYDGSNDTHKRYHGICRFYRINNGIDLQTLYDFGVFREIWLYNEGQLYEHRVINNSFSSYMHFDNDGKLISKEVYNKQSQTDTSITYANNREYRTVLKYDSLHSVYIPFKTSTTYFNSDGTPSKTVELYKNTYIVCNAVYYNSFAKSARASTLIKGGMSKHALSMKDKGTEK